MKTGDIRLISCDWFKCWQSTHFALAVIIGQISLPIGIFRCKSTFQFLSQLEVGGSFIADASHLESIKSAIYKRKIRLDIKPESTRQIRVTRSA